MSGGNIGTNTIISLTRLLEPLQTITDADSLSSFCAEFGWNVNLGPTDYSSIQTALGISDIITNIATDLSKLPADDETSFIKDIADLLAQLKSLLTSLSNLSYKTIFSTVPVLQNWSDFAEDIVDYLIYTFVENYYPTIFGTLCFFGIITDVQVPPDASIGRGSYIQKRINWNRLPKIFTDFSGLMSDVYNWGSTIPSGDKAFQYDTLLNNLGRLFNGFGLRSAMFPISDNLISLFNNPQYQEQITELDSFLVNFFSGATLSSVEVDIVTFPILSDKTTSGYPNGVSVGPVIKGSTDINFDIGSNLKLSITGGFQAEGGIRIEIRPGNVTPVTSIVGTINENVTLSTENNTPFVLLGSSNSSRIQVGNFSAKLFINGSVTDPEFGIEVTASGAKLVVQKTQEDGFLDKVLPSDPIELDFDLTIGFSNKKRFYVKGAGSLEYDIPIHKSIGPISLDSIDLKLAFPDKEVDLVSTISGGVIIGPVAAEVEGIGLKTAFTFDGQNGLAGSADLKFEFKPPDGLGLSIDAGPVTGGGYIQLDPDKGEYAGIFQLGIDIPVESIEITVIGILDTKLPGGVPGYSFLIIVTSEFTPIELGFGFTLNEVGGLAGINRSMSLDALRAGVKNHSLDSVLFPPDPIIPKAPQIISQISSIFPVTEGSYVFGIMLELGWGDPQIIDAELGIILELPDPVNIALLGNFKAGLPSVEDPDLAIVFLQIDILGIIDFEHQQFTLQGTLYNSRVVEFQISGGMSMLLDWSPSPQFILSIGGFNPHFQVPAGFQVPDPITLSLSVGPVTLNFHNNYFAVTSNSVQAGAHVEISAAAAGFGLEGHLGFDTVFNFHPFSFIVDMSAGVTILAGGSPFLSVCLDCSLSGPRPWHAHGQASFTIVFVTISIPVDVTIGDPADSQPIPQIAVLPLLQAGLQSANAWSAQLPSAVDQLVTFAKAPSGDQTLYVHPMGSITIRQKVVPLNTQIDKFGSAKPSDGSSYAISDIAVNTQSQTVPSPTDIEDKFARGQFQSLSDSDQLSKPSFEDMPSGTHIGTTDFQTSKIPNQELDLTYDTYYVETPIQPATIVKDGYRPSPDVLAASIGLGPSTNSPARNIGAWKYVPPGITPAVTVQSQKYTIVSTQTLAPVSGIVPQEGSSMTAAEGALQTHLSDHPEDVGQLQVVPVQEAQAA